MKRLIAVTAITVLFLPSCSKFRDQIKHHPEDIGKCCQIKSATAYLGQSYQQFDFTYDSSGKPVTMFAQNPTGFQYFHLYMLYDEMGRLKVFTTLGDMWQAYGYPSPNTIIDSFSYTSDTSSFLYATTITLDSKGRAIRYSYLSTGSQIPPTITDVSYDSRGNAITPGVTYDDKINPLQTNKILQLLGRDYSRNNQIATVGGVRTSPVAYNKYGLPTQFKRPATALQYLLFLWDGYDSLSIKYSCVGDSVERAK